MHTFTHFHTAEIQREESKQAESKLATTEMSMLRWIESTSQAQLELGNQKFKVCQIVEKIKKTILKCMGPGPVH